MGAPSNLGTWFGLLTGLSLLANVATAGELPVARPEDAGMSSMKLEKVDVAVTDLIQQKKLAGATVVIARHGKVIYSKVFGKMDMEANKSMREDAIFRIYSMTKAITSAAALMLYEEGKFKLDEPVSKYLPEFSNVKIWSASGGTSPQFGPSIRDLMRHTAGMTYGSFGDTPVHKMYQEANLSDPDIDLKTLSERIAKLPLLCQPSTRWTYGYSVDVLGRLIEVLSGQSFDVFLQERIFTPLDMHDTDFYVPKEKLDRFAASYNSDGKGQLTLQDAPATSKFLKKPKNLSGGGGLVSTTRDYLRFLQMIANLGELDGKRLLKPQSVSLMTHNQLPRKAVPIEIMGTRREGVGFGLGFSYRFEASPQWDPASPVTEYGWDGAASTHYWVLPKDQLIVVTMEQTMPFSFLLEQAVKGLIYQSIEK